MRRTLAREYDAHHNFPLCRDVLDLLEDAHFIWTSYIDEVISTLPAYCMFGRHIWRASIPLICLDIIEHHASERVFRQFGLPQPIPSPPAWLALHYERDDRFRVDDIFMAWLDEQLGTWDRRGDLTPPPQHFPIQRSMAWYRTISRLFIGNPVHQAHGQYVPYAGRHEALAIELHTVYHMGQQMQSHVHDPVAMQEYSHRFMDVAAQTLQRARSDQRLAHKANYMDLAQYQRGRGIPRAGCARRAGGAGRRGHGRRGGGPQQGGVEDPADMAGDMHETNMSSYSLGIYRTPVPSQMTPSGQLLITGSNIQGVDWGRYFSGPSTTDEDRTTRDFYSERRLSYGSTSHAQASCDAATDDYIQDPDTMMPSTGPDSTTDTCHPAPHPAIRRQLDDDDPDSAPGREGMCLRPATALRHTGCGTH
ncbi:uncharacterized protein LOC107783803 [Nicotiana tabacum]|uniref:Uncharacterized protein LOC107783803 n=1 Tax=Nicotiana tabacum TaxID=4097 RepID=A0AC58SB26_TOBAC